MSVLDQLVKELNERQKHSSPTGTPTGPSIHGPNSLFGVPGVERDVISTRMSVQGLASQIPAVGSVKTQPLFAYITGRTAPSGEQPTADCADGPVSGAHKVCLQTAQFGTYKFRTRELNITTVGELVNDGERTDLRFVNDPLAQELAAFIPNVNTDMALDYGREVLARFVDVGMDFQDLLSQQLYVGTGTGNEFPGLEILVSETHYDAKTGQLCEALESDIRDFGDVDVTGSTGAANIVTELVSMYRYASHTASRTGLAPVEFAFVMREQLFHEIADIWPCAYLTSRCNTVDSDGKTVFVNADEQVQLRMQQRQGSYLLVDDQEVPVITDDALVEEDLGGGTFASDIYLLPLTVRGGRSVLFWEYFDYSRGTVPAIRDGRAEDDFWTDRGVYLWHKQPPRNGCVVWQAQTSMRVILETPQIAARLMNVAYSVDKHYRDSIPGMNYYQNGGVEDGYATPTPLYDGWANTP